MKQFSILALFTLLFFSICNGQKNSNGWTNLFDSRTFNGWKKVAGNAEYSINNRVITGTTVPNTPNTFLVKEKEYGDFILELEVMIEDTTSNSGIQFRSHFDTAANNGKGRVYDYQYELDPSMRRWTGGLYDEGRRGWLHPLTLNPSGQNTLVQLIKHG